MVILDKLMDPQYEQRLREEVIYLHSLWHQGPPRPAVGGQAPNFFQPLNTTYFKREGRPGDRRGRKSKKNANNEAPEPMSSPGKEWTSITPSPAEATSSWGNLAAKPVQSPQLPSPEEQLKFAARNAQRKALKTVREFLMSNNDGADGETCSVDSSSDEDDEFMEEDDERQEYTFFLKVLMEDVELKDYYEKNYAKGEFSCLICGAVGGKNTGKKFKGCLPLVQHSITVAKTKRKRAHRAYGQAVCKIFGWDIDRLSTVVSLLSDNSAVAQVGEKADDKDNSIGIDNKVVSEYGNNCEIVAAAATFGSGSLSFTDKGIINSTGEGANNTLEGLDMVQPSNVEETVTGGLASIFLVADDANNTTEGLRVLDLSNVEETVAEESTIVGEKAVDKDSSIGIDDKVVSEYGNNGEVVPEAATFGSGSLSFTDKGIIVCDACNSTGTGANNTLEGLDMVQPSNVEETVTVGLASNSSVADDANNTTEGLRVVDLSNVEETVAEESTIGSLMGNSGVVIGMANDVAQKEDGASNR